MDFGFSEEQAEQLAAREIRVVTGIVDSLEPFKADPLVHDPGAAFTYSTYGYVVLGCVIEGASGMKYADYVRDNVAKPAGMERTRPDDLASIVPNRAHGYAKLPSGELRNCDLADTSNKVPGGGIVSTAVDLGRFAVARGAADSCAPLARGTGDGPAGAPPRRRGARRG